MAPKRRVFRRTLGVRRYRKLFVIATEGTKTEPQYFGIFNDQQSVIHVKCLGGSRRSAPPQVLARMAKYLGQEALLPSDEAWLVVDKDQWTDAQLAQLHAWSLTKENYGFALSNPKFEYWLLLHFEDGTGIASSRDYTARLAIHLPGYEKGVDSRRITRENIDAAIRRARSRDNPPCPDWPREPGSSTVYRLVERMIRK